MTVQNIKAAIDSALPIGAQGRYPNEYSNLVTALTEREYDITDAVVEQVTQRFGVSESQVKAQAEALGLAVRPEPEPEPEPEAPAAELTVEDRLSKVEESLASIASSVAALSSLADRHLGARR